MGHHTHSRRTLLALTLLTLHVLLCTEIAEAQRAPVRAADPMSVSGIVFDAYVPDQARAERIFASSEAAIWFPGSGLVRAVDASGVLRAPTDRDVRDFLQGLERDYPGYRTSTDRPYLLKLPARARAFRIASAASALPEATVSSDSFESGLGSWTRDDNTLGLYAWGTTTCESRTGSYSADAVRGGVNTLGCSDLYTSNVTTSMVHSACEAVAGASQAWLDTWVHIATETGYDTLGFFYADNTDDWFGYTFSGTWNAWFHIVLNLKQWYRVGDVTATTCPRVLVQFESDVDTESGIGARVDDLTVSTSTPSFLACSISASVKTGSPPLTVNFSPNVSGATGSTTYLWSFGDSASTTASTPTAQFTYTETGEYRVRLRVDDSGVRAYAHETITVASGPVCSLSCSAIVPATATAGSSVAFQASAVASGCSGTPSYSWSFGDGQSSSQRNPSHSYATPGTYSWTLTTTVDQQSCQRSGTITVLASGGKPRRHPVRRDGEGNTLASATIGSGGGTLNGGGFTLTVPPGAFGTTTTLTLSKANTAREEGDVSNTFVIDGLPERLYSNVTMEVDPLPGSRTPGSNEKYYLSVEGAGYAKSKAAEDEDDPVPYPIEAALSGNRIRATVPSSWPIPGASLRAATPAAESTSDVTTLVDTRRCHVKAEVLQTYSTAHFYALSYPSRSATATSVLNLLESHYQKLTGMGYSLSCRLDGSGNFRKIRVDLEALGTGSDAPLGYHVSGGDPCGTNWLFASDHLVITTSVPATEMRVRAATAHELFHLVQDMYSSSARSNLWLKEASSVWLETSVGNSCPDVQSGYNMFAHRGLFNSRNSSVDAFWTSDREQRHGYGASYALVYGAQTTGGDSFARVIWDNVKLGNGEIASFEAAVGSSLSDFWTAFSKAYYFGNLTGGCPVSWSGFERVTVSDEKAIPQSFAVDAYPLSSVSWALDLQKFASAETVATAIAADGLEDGQKVYIYDVRTKAELGELTKTQPSYPVDDLNDLKGTIVVLVFVDTNLPVSGSANDQASTNKVTLKLGTDDLRCHAVYKVATYKRATSSGGYEVCTGNCRVYDGSISSLFLGSIQNDTFKFTKMWCPEPPFYCRWNELTNVDNDFTFTLIEKGAKASGFSLRESFNDLVGNPQYETLAVSSPLSLLSKTETAFEYRIDGAGVCSIVTFNSSMPVSEIVCDGGSFVALKCEANSP